ncbi:MAG: rhodanese-related sulfurtransferase [Candidatus Pacebacteria bacterium]|nr:rhodanese-related sulfurtransferase [Candidatus Paceibacterota bacterium]
MTYQVLLFYKYVTIEDSEAFARDFRVAAEKLGLTGRTIIAEEGINSTLEGTAENTEEFAEWILSDERFADMIVKRSAGTGHAFPKLSVKVRKEIVGTRFPQEKADPRVCTAPRLTPEELKAMYEQDDDFVVVDMRNDYEYASGHFKNSINPGLENSRDLPEALPELEPLRKKKVVTVCTGGIRCEKMSAFLMNSGFEDVYQLENGIHGYMEKFPGEDYLGTLYTFDGRVTMDFGGDNREIIGACRLCEGKTERYVNCANNDCHLHFLCCENCAASDGSAHCSDLCRAKLVGA